MYTAAVAGAALVVAATILRHKLLVVDVVGWSMHPTYNSGDRLLVLRTRSVRAGHVVVTDPPAPGRRWDGREISPPPARSRLIKRVAAGPHDRIPERFLPAVGAERGGSVPSGMFLLLGDNASSLDSTQLGYCPVSALIGRVIGTLHSVRR